MARRNQIGDNDKALMVLTGIVVAVTSIGILYSAQRVLIPVALALLVAFLLNPIVMKFQHRGLPRAFAVIAVTLLSATLMLGFGWLVGSQVVGLAAELPDYTSNIKKKIHAVDSLSQDSVWARLGGMIHDLEVAAGMAKDVKNQSGLTKGLDAAPQPIPVVVEQAEPAWLRSLPNVFGPATELLGQMALVVVLVIFVLLAREDLRNRFIRLIGHGRLTITTKAVDDASQRISRFLLTQLGINGIFGVCVAIGLAIIGVQYALLWGVLCGVMRYIPYIGSPIAALFPMVLSIAQFEGWLQPALVCGLIVGLELVISNVFEPWLFGQSIGVSAVALLIAAAFWAFLWGPVGLVLSCPLTVCLVVLGKYVPQLEFLAILLGEEPPLEEDFTYYQRLTAHDQDEAEDIVLDYIKDHGHDEVYDALLIPAMVNAGRDQQRQGLDEGDVQFIHEATREILVTIEDDRLERKAKAPAAAVGQNQHEDLTTVEILGVAARGEPDELGLEMLRQMLADESCQMTIAGKDVLASELLAMVEKRSPQAVCIAALPPGGLTHARFLCKRLRTRFPKLRILVGRWGLKGTEEKHDKALREAGADNVRTTLVASRDDLIAWLPALAEKTNLANGKAEVLPLPAKALAR